MDINVIPFILLSFLFSSFLKGITGLGFSTVCLPILTIFIDPKISIPLVILPSLTSNVLVMIQAGQFRTALGRFWLVYISVIPGLFLGVYILLSSESSNIRAILGIVLIMYVAWAFRGRVVDFTRRAECWLSTPVGLCTGLVNGMTGSQVMPLLPFMLSLRLDRDIFIQSINISFTFSSIVMLLLLNRVGLLNAEMMRLSFLGILPVAAGIFVGGKVRGFLKEDYYRQAVLGILMVIGFSLILRG